MHQLIPPDVGHKAVQEPEGLLLLQPGLQGKARNNTADVCFRSQQGSTWSNQVSERSSCNHLSWPLELGRRALATPQCVKSNQGFRAYWLWARVLLAKRLSKEANTLDTVQQAACLLSEPLLGKELNQRVLQG